ncbi:hypothetical protein BEL04_14645 [Mucilaginibacter sp. PPCGB 2223]|uniref:hypothetical protein n=1 Tax=Mucilaginibacter sp. PPCGB 2223 TaxID=1886027 RepID=UPI0008256ACE|nr:hypothetical protein [Mucilaginibacter sp. PPCGB 2223]OCX52682.1 hypothetical protein BEL04_14645 [Mucilaginibacter sp. PPCGB 2223]
MVHAFRVGILNFLREHNATTAVIDIKNPFLTELNTIDKRKAFKQALDTLSNEKMIVVSGSYDFLNWKLINGLYPIDDKIIEAKITAKGLSYQAPAEVNDKVAEPDEPLDLPLPPPVKAISSWFGGGTKEVTEQRLKRKMKKMGAKDSHLDFQKPSDEPQYQTKHVPAVVNPFVDDSFDNHENDEIETTATDEPGLRISLQGKSATNSKKNKSINKVLKWVVIVVSIILVILIAMIFKSNS